MRARERNRLCLKSLLMAGVASAIALPASAQDSDIDDDADTIVVTGSRLNTNPNLAAAQPVLSVTDEEIDLRGTVRIEDLTNILPQVFAGQAGEVSNGANGTATLNLRGLGAVRTLVLLDGRRLPYGDSSSSPANLDIIPAQLIQQVDILTGGASAVYGSDAVAGVANFVLKRDFEGIELDILGGIAQNSNGVEFFDNILAAGNQPIPGVAWDGEELNLALTVGANTADGRGNVTLFAAYETREAILQSDRSISACALGQDNSAFSSNGFGCVGSSNFRRFFGLTDDSGDVFQLEDGTLIDFVGSPQTTFNFGPFNFFQRPSERFQIFARGHYEITDNLEAYADLAFSNNSSDAQIAPTASFGFFEINCDNPLIQQTPGQNLVDVFGCTPADIAAGNDISVFASHRNVEGGPRNSNLENTTWRIVSGLKGTIADVWDWDAFFQYSRTQDVDISTNDFIVANVQDAFFLVEDDDGNVVCRSGNPGCVPFNIFQRGPNGESLVTQEALDFIQGVGITTGETGQLVIGASAQADLGEYGISSPFSDAGVGFLFGIEYRDDDLDAVPDEISQIPGGGFTGVGGPTLPVSGSLDVFEIFSEVQIPIVTGQPFFEELVFSGQYRYSDYSADGNGTQNSFTTDAFGLNLSWIPVPDIKFRAQFQRAVRAPNVIELFTGLGTNLPNLSSAGTNGLGEQLFDPCSSSQPIASLAACMNTGVTAAQFGGIPDVISGQTQSITGGNPLLSPESSDTLTLGFVFTPQSLPELSISFDYFDISVEDYISAGISAQVTLDNCLATGDPVFCSLITRAPNGSLIAGTAGVGFQATNVNIANLATSGVDIQVLYRYDLGEYGGLRFDYAGTYLDQFDFTPFPGGDPIECAGFFGNACGDVVSPVNPTFRHRALTTWSTPADLDVTVTWRYSTGTNNDNRGDFVEPRIGAEHYIDLSFNYPVAESLRLRAGVLNLFNNQPPLFSSAGPPLGNGNTFPVSFDTGRFLFAGATISF